MITDLPTVDMKDSPTGCCPRFKPEPWDEREFSLEGLSFVKVSNRNFFYLPLNMGSVMRRTQKAIADAGAAPTDRYIMLSRELSPWKTEHLILVTKEVAGLENASVTGKWLTKVFEGPYSKMGAWYGEMLAYVKAQGKEAKEVQAFYTTCPRCAKAYGKNYVVLFARVD